MATKGSSTGAQTPGLVFTWEGTDRKGNPGKGESRARPLRWCAPICAAARASCRCSAAQEEQLDLYRPQEEDHGKDIAIFSRQLATMMAARRTHGSGLRHRRRGRNNPAMAEMILAIPGG